MIGHQNGSFPEIGWHIKGEMGGIWNHPIKLMDGFDIELAWEDFKHSLNDAYAFVNYPMANQHLFNFEDKGIEVERWQFVPDELEGLVVQLILNNKSAVDQDLKLIFKGHVDLRPTWLADSLNVVDSRDTATFDIDLNVWVAKDAENPMVSAFWGGSDPFRLSNQ